jgi:hypothetical protein
MSYRIPETGLLTDGWYVKFMYDEALYVVENTYDMRNRTSIDSLLVYNTFQNRFPGIVMAALNVTKRWPSWEVSRSSSLSKGVYDIFYLGYTHSSTRIVRTKVNLIT